MLFNDKLLKASLIPCKGESRYTMQGFMLETTRRVLVATDGYRLTVHEVKPCPTDVDGLIPTDALVAAAKEWKAIKARPADAVVIDASDPEEITVKVFGKVKWSGARPEGNFPNWEAIVPHAATKPAKMVISFNAKMLYEMMQALSSSDRPTDVVTLHITDAQSSITVLGSNGYFDERLTQSLGVLMPHRDPSTSIPRFWDVKQDEPVEAPAVEELAATA